MVTIYAVLADIHGNWAALKQVARDARKIARREKADLHFICLGDVIDYGPQPNECMDWVNKWCPIVVRGNHETAMEPTCDLIPYSTIGEEWWPITWWTCRTLKKKHRDGIRTWASQQKLEEHFLLFHGSLKWGREDGRIKDSHSAAENMAELPAGLRYGLFGHTHFQGYYVERHDGATAYLTGADNHPTDRWRTAPLETWFEVPGRKAHALFNPGSVGQPRLHPLFLGRGIRDNRACYMLIKLNGQRKQHIQFRFQRVPYDVEETVRKLREIRLPAIKPSKGSDITRGGDPPPRTDPLARKFAQVKKDPELLHRLIEETLIPILQLSG